MLLALPRPFRSRRSVCSGEVVLIGGLRCAPAAEAVAKALALLPFADALVLADACARRREVLGDSSAPSRDEIVCAGEAAPWTHGRTRALAVLAQADPLSESPGESFSRAAMIEGVCLLLPCSRC